jgi:hypothetical protein
MVLRYEETWLGASRDRNEVQHITALVSRMHIKS